MEDRNVINGTWGEVWLDSEYVAECISLQAKIEFTKEDVVSCRRLSKGTKITGWEGKGSFKLKKVNSRMGKKLSTSIKQGKFPTFTVISKLADPDALGVERIVLKGVSFDDLTLMDWEATKNGETEVPFTFTDYDYLDKI